MLGLKPKKLKNRILKRMELHNKLLVKDGDKCQKCPSTTDLTLEHIIPYWFLKEWLHYTLKDSYKDEWNFKILCKLCNREKSGSIDFSNKEIRENFLRYLEMIPIK